jgi:hypothetical protein
LRQPLSMVILDPVAHLGGALGKASRHTMGVASMRRIEAVKE